MTADSKAIQSALLSAARVGAIGCVAGAMQPPEYWPSWVTPNAGRDIEDFIRASVVQRRAAALAAPQRRAA